jgi:integrase
MTVTMVVTMADAIAATISVCERMVVAAADLYIGLLLLPPSLPSPAGEWTLPSVEGQVAAWVRRQQQLVSAGQLAADHADNHRICLGHFRDWAGPDADVGTLDARSLQDFYLFCLQKVEIRKADGVHKAGWSVDYARKVFRTARGFVKWLWEADLIAPPRNIDSRGFRFNAGAKAVRTWTPDEFKRAVGLAPGKLKLALLLMANCGMTQKDVSDLADEEVDWVAGRITRKRSKKAGCDNVPTICYPLWPTTFALLKQHRSGTARVLLTESGLPFLRKELRDGKLVKADGFASNYTHLKKRLKEGLPGFNRSLKQLRKLGATLLESQRDYGRFKSYFLGHSPRTVADRHYAAPSQELFDEAVWWLGQELGQCPKPNTPGRRSAK